VASVFVCLFYCKFFGFMVCFFNCRLLTDMFLPIHYLVFIISVADPVPDLDSNKFSDKFFLNHFLAEIGML
jgi:hypothetical protein